MVAAVVATSETILYIIWESRKSATRRPNTRRRAARQQKDAQSHDRVTMDGSSAVAIQEQIPEHPDGLRQRVTKAASSKTLV